VKKGDQSEKEGERWFLQFQLQDLWSRGDSNLLWYSLISRLSIGWSIFIGGSE